MVYDWLRPIWLLFISMHYHIILLLLLSHTVYLVIYILCSSDSRNLQLIDRISTSLTRFRLTVRTWLVYLWRGRAGTDNPR